MEIYIHASWKLWMLMLIIIFTNFRTAFKGGRKYTWENLSIKKTYLSVNWGDRCHLDIEHSFVIIHPLHAWELNLPQCDIKLI